MVEVGVFGCSLFGSGFVIFVFVFGVLRVNEVVEVMNVVFDEVVDCMFFVCFLFCWGVYVVEEL